MRSPATLAYMAGLIDGEGSFYIKFRKKKGCNYRDNALWFRVSNNDLNMLLWIRDNFGGDIWQHTPKNKPKNQKQSFVWHAGVVLSREILPEILPYLITKKERAELFLEYAKTCERGNRIGGGDPRLKPEVITKRLSIQARMSELNRRGLSVSEMVN